MKNDFVTLLNPDIVSRAAAMGIKITYWYAVSMTV